MTDETIKLPPIPDHITMMDRAGIRNYARAAVLADRAWTADIPRPHGPRRRSRHEGRTMTDLHIKPKRVFDVELFDLAARAAGITLEWWDDGESLNPGYIVNREGDWVSWDPERNDDDAFRLLVDLRLETADIADSQGRHEWWIGYQDEDKRIEYLRQAVGDDPAKSARLAIVRAAAEIGRRMKS